MFSVQRRTKTCVQRSFRLVNCENLRYMAGATTRDEEKMRRDWKIIGISWIELDEARE